MLVDSFWIVADFVGNNFSCFSGSTTFTHGFGGGRVSLCSSFVEQTGYVRITDFDRVDGYLLMVANITSLTRNGLRDWLLQRVSAVVLLLYFLVLGFFFCSHKPLTYGTLQAFFYQDWVRVFSLLALLSVLLHAWIGIWTVLTDYVKCSCLRLILEVVVALALLSMVAWGIIVLWSL